MGSKDKQPVIVAELGRPETAAETASRKANDTRLYRQRKTVNNLVFSLLVSLALVFVIVLAVPRGTGGWEEHAVDVAAAAEIASSPSMPVIAPVVPEDWKAKQAQLRAEGNSKIEYWYIGYTTSTESYAAVVQAFLREGGTVDETWIATQLENQTATGTETIGGLTWTVYDHSERSADDSNMLFGLQTEVGGVTLLVYGTDSADTLRELAKAVAAQAALLDLEHVGMNAEETS